ncbi:MAG: acyl-CoA dehydrogenase family protein [Desulfatirhabdiaceae bacterium]
MSILTDEQLKIQERVRHLAQQKIRPKADEIDQRDEYPADIVRLMADEGLLKLGVPKKYGGFNADTTTLSLVISELSQAMAPMGSLVLSTQSVVKIIKAFGSEDLKHRVFTDLSSGDKLLAFCLTEPDAGSDAHSLTTEAVLQGDHYVVNGQKRWITLATVADYYLVVVRTGGKSKKDDLSALLIHRDTPGLSFGKKDRKLGMRGSVTADVLFQDARVPKENLVGKEGQGWHILTNFSNSMRCWGAASIALGIAQGALDHAVAYAKKRKQFGKPISDFQATRFKLADMEMQVEAARSLIYRTNAQVDREGDLVTDRTMSWVSMSKCFAADVAMKVTIDAVQILGSYGLLSSSPVQRMMRDAKGVQIFDGSNQIQRIIISKNLLSR